MFVPQNQNKFRNSNANVQIFYGGGDSGAGNNQSWLKPVGISHVYIMCIGSGGNGNGPSATGGGSGAVTVWYGAAQHIPDLVYVRAGAGEGYGGSESRIFIRTTSTTAITLIEAQGGNGVTGGAAMTANYFAASGFFNSVAGQNGSSGDVASSATTFLSGGAGFQGTVFANYGYSAERNGQFYLQPIIVGLAAGEKSGVATSNSGGIGCGGSRNGFGGPGMVLIASW